MMRVLLSETSVEVRIKGAVTEQFETNIGSPQGDSYSGPQFTMYFEEALKDVREETDISLTEDLPTEMIYADDYDNLTEEVEKKKQFKGKVKEVILARSDLGVNEGKTEDTILRRAKHDRKNKTTNEPWRETIKLGSKLGDKEDIQRRKNLSTGKLVQMKKILQNKKVVDLGKMKLYNTLVKSVLTYNSCTWGMTKDDEKNLDSFHRKQLRQVVGIYYPHRISNEKL